MEIEASALASYVRDQIEHGELTSWTVFLATGDGRPVELGSRTVPSVIRRPLAKQREAGRYVVKSILNPPDEAIDLTDVEYGEAMRRTTEARAMAKDSPPDRPSGVDIRGVRGRRPESGLLILYPLDPKTDGLVDWEGALIGTVISFPDSDTANRRIYLENTVMQKERAGR